jgi:hypothetical protein
VVGGGADGETGTGVIAGADEGAAVATGVGVSLGDGTRSAPRPSPPGSLEMMTVMKATTRRPTKPVWTMDRC